MTCSFSRGFVDPDQHDHTPGVNLNHDMFHSVFLNSRGRSRIAHTRRRNEEDG
jgi:hypothetical protein